MIFVTWFVIVGHLLWNFLLGWLILSFLRKDRTFMESVSSALLLGILAETMFVFILLWFGCSLNIAVLALVFLTLAVAFWRKLAGHLSLARPKFQKLRWYEWLLGITVLEKVAFAWWQISRTPVYFDDALTHWAGRGRSIFGALNWSFDPVSNSFLGFTGTDHYPLLAPIWRAVTAVLRGEWNDILARADSLVFFVILLVLIWITVRRFSGQRWLSAAATFVVAVMPLQVWHAAAGYMDIAMEVFVVAAVAAVLRREWLIAGIMAAGTVWSKNDGLVLFVPALLILVFLSQLEWSEIISPSKWIGEKMKNVGYFLGGFLTVSPWLIFKALYGLGIMPSGGGLEWHADAPGLLWRVVVMGETSGVFWILALLALAVLSYDLFRDRVGRALLISFIIVWCGLIFIFGATSAYEWLLNQMTVHRSVLQASSMGVLVIFYGLYLRWNRYDKKHPLATKE